MKTPGVDRPILLITLMALVAVCIPLILSPETGESGGDSDLRKTGLEALKTAALLVSLPLLAVYLLLAMSIVRRFGGRRP